MKFYICNKCNKILDADYTETKNKNMFCQKCNRKTKHKLIDILLVS